MAKIKIEGFILKSGDTWRDYFTFHNTEMLESGYLTVCPNVVEFEIPAGFNPVKAKLDGLEKQKTAFMVGIAQINEEIRNLTCLEFNPTEPVAEVVDSYENPF